MLSSIPFTNSHLNHRCIIYSIVVGIIVVNSGYLPAFSDGDTIVACALASDPALVSYENGDKVLVAGLIFHGIYSYVSCRIRFGVFGVVILYLVLSYRGLVG